MERDLPRPDRVFDADITYVALREAINNEMARHNALAHEYDQGSAISRRHLESVAALAEVRRRLDPTDDNLLTIVLLMLESQHDDSSRRT